MLGALAAVEQPQVGALGQAHSHRRNIAAAAWHSGTSAQKSDLQWRYRPAPALMVPRQSNSAQLDGLEFPPFDGAAASLRLGEGTRGAGAGG